MAKSYTIAFNYLTDAYREGRARVFAKGQISRMGDNRSKLQQGKVQLGGVGGGGGSRNLESP